MRHGDFTLYETSAICRYLDTAFDGPMLVPQGAREQVQMEQWISALNDYVDRDIIRRFVIEYVFPKGEDGTPRMDVINEALIDIRRDLAVFNDALHAGPYLFGANPTIPDFFLLPMVDYVAVIPAGDELYQSPLSLTQGRLARPTGRRALWRVSLAWRLNVQRSFSMAVGIIGRRAQRHAVSRCVQDPAQLRKHSARAHEDQSRLIRNLSDGDTTLFRLRKTRRPVHDHMVLRRARLAPHPVAG